MWEDFKKLGGLLVDQTKEQKDIALLRLREMSYKNKREDALAKLGQAVYAAMRAGEEVNRENLKIGPIVKEIEEIDDELAQIATLVADLKRQAATERETLATEVEGVWEKTKTAFSGDDTEPQADKAPETEENKEAEPEKKTAKKAAKKAAKKSAKKTVKKTAKKTAKKTEKSDD